LEAGLWAALGQATAAPRTLFAGAAVSDPFAGLIAIIVCGALLLSSLIASGYLEALRATRGVEVAIVVSDTFGRPWRNGLTDVAIGVSGLAAIVDLRGTEDALGRELQVTEVAIADEVAAAAELVMGKAAAVPAAIVRGLDPAWLREGSARDLVRAPADDLFR